MFDRRALVATLVLIFASTVSAQEPRLQDPMRPRVVTGAETPGRAVPEGLSLTAVLVSDSRRIAVINGRIYHVGDRVNGEEILAIEPGVVRIRQDGRVVQVRIREGGVVTAGNDGEQGR